MFAYLVRRLLLVIPTLFGIMVLNFVIVQAAPGGPVEQMLAEFEGNAVSATARISGETEDSVDVPGSSSGSDASVDIQSRATRGLDPELVDSVKKLYGFDKPPVERFILMMKSYLRLDFGDSFFRDASVFELVKEKMPVSISLGLWTTLIMYLVSIPLGIKKAIRDGSSFDVWTSGLIIVGYAIPGFLFAIMLVVLFAGGSYFDWFPLRGLVSENFDSLNPLEKALDYAWHLVLPLTAMLVGAFATLTMLTKNSFLDEINKQYVLTARAKGLTENRVLYGHVFRNAMLIVVAGFPAAFVGILFSSSMLIEIIFSLDGLGLLGYEALVNRDYPVMFGTLFVFTFLGLIMGIIGDVMYTVIDPRIDFERRDF